MPQSSLSGQDLGSWQGQTTSGNGRGFDLQRLRILYYRLPEQVVSGGREKGRSRQRDQLDDRGKTVRRQGKLKRHARGRAFQTLRNQTEEGSDGMTVLICPDCRHENEPTRVYCHDCGAKLNRASLTKEKAADGNLETQQRMRRMFGGKQGRTRQIVLKLGKLILGAGVAAAIVLMLQRPDVPERKKTELLSTQINLELEKATMAPQGTQLRFTEEQVNAYLLNGLKSKKAQLDKWLLHFERAVVKFDEGVCRISVERSIFRYPLYTTVVFEVTAQNGQLITSNRGGSIGRLPIHPAIMKYGDVIFADVWKALERDRKMVAKLAAIEFHPQSVVLTAPAQ